MASIQLQDVCKHYDNGHVAVTDLDLDVHDGEFMVIVGPSGCGKSTTLRMVAGLEAITNGNVRLGDRRINDVAPGERDVAMVFQNYALYPHLTGRDNLSFGLKTRKLAKSEIQSRVAEAAELLSIQSLLERRPEQMSGGEKQRIALGRAIVRKPAAFLFDEPLSNLDAQLRVQMRIQLAKLHQRLKTTTLYVTHDQSEAMTLADRLAVLQNGRLQQVGTPLEVYDRPANRFVAGFIGSPGMNFIDGKVTDGCFLTQNISYAIPNISIPDGNYLLGFRPENASFASGGSRLTDATVTVVEHLGYETIAHCRIPGGNTTVAVRTERKTDIAKGDSVTLHLDADCIHLFSTEDGQRID